MAEDPMETLSQKQLLTLLIRKVEAFDERFLGLDHRIEALELSRVSIESKLGQLDSLPRIEATLLDIVVDQKVAQKATDAAVVLKAANQVVFDRRIKIIGAVYTVLLILTGVGAWLANGPDIFK